MAILILIIFLLCPVASLPFILLGIYRGRTYCDFALIAFICLLAYTCPPIADLKSFYFNYCYVFPYVNYNYILTLNLGDYAWSSLFFVLSKAKLSFQYGLVLSCFIQLMILRYILKDTNYLGLLGCKRVILIIAVFLMCGFWDMLLIRFHLASKLFILGYYFFYKRKYGLMVVFMFLSCLVHFSFMMFIGLSIFSVLNKRKGIFFYLIVGVVVGLTISVVANTLLENGYSAAAYVTESKSWARGSTGAFFIAYFVLKPVFFWISVVYMIRAKEGLFIRSFALLLITLALVTLVNETDLSQRFQIVAEYITVLHFLIYGLNEKIFAWFNCFILAFIIRTFVCSLLYYRTILVSDFTSVLCSPVLYTLTRELYDYNWINRHLYEGEIYRITN